MKSELRSRLEEIEFEKEIDTWIYGIEECVFQCKFCAFHGNNVKVPDPVKVYTDFHNAFVRVGWDKKHNFRLSDPVSNLKRKDYREYFRSVLEFIANDDFYNIEKHSIVFYARINLMDDYYYDLLEEYSHKLRIQVFFGLENLDDKILDDMNKGFHYEDIKKVFIELSKMKGKILVSGSFIFGTPLETEESFQLNLKRMKELRQILNDADKPNTFTANPLELVKNSIYYKEREKYPEIFDDTGLKEEWQKLAAYRASEFCFIADRDNDMNERRMFILDIDEDYFFLPVFSGELITPQSKRDEVYYKAPKQVDDIINKFNMYNSKPHYKLFTDHHEVYYDLMKMQNKTKYKLIHVDAHSDVEPEDQLKNFVHLGNWITYLVKEDLLDPEIIWINQSKDKPHRIRFTVDGKEYFMNISTLDNLKVPSDLSIDITFWTRSPEFCPTNNLEQEFRSKLRHLIKLN